MTQANRINSYQNILHKKEYDTKWKFGYTHRMKSNRHSHK